MKPENYVRLLEKKKWITNNGKLHYGDQTKYQRQHEKWNTQNVNKKKMTDKTQLYLKEVEEINPYRNEGEIINLYQNDLPLKN